MRKGEEPALLPLILDLWPDAEDYDFSGDVTFVWEEGPGALGGFAVVNIRPFSNACEDAPCPHLEGWYVAPRLRRQGVGRALIAACEDWCRERGFDELGSDVLIDNDVSHEAHERLGFEPREVVKYYRKAL